MLHFVDSVCAQKTALENGKCRSNNCEVQKVSDERVDDTESGDHEEADGENLEQFVSCHPNAPLPYLQPPVPICDSSRQNRSDQNTNHLHRNTGFDPCALATKMVELEEKNKLKLELMRFSYSYVNVDRQKVILVCEGTVRRLVVVVGGSANVFDEHVRPFATDEFRRGACLKKGEWRWMWRGCLPAYIM